MEFDIPEMEKQRYENIKKSGEYIELDILIGTESKSVDGYTRKTPVISSCMQNCGLEEIASMYVVLKNMVELYEEKYPEACLFAKLTMNSSRMWTITNPTDSKEK